MTLIERLEQATDVRVGFSTSRVSPISRVIRWFTGGPTSHAFLSFALPGLPCREVLEATWPRVVIRPAVENEANVGEFKPPPGVDLRRGLVEAAKCLGEHYDLGGLVGMAPVELLRRIGKHMANPLQADRQRFCSELCDLAMRVAGWPGTESLNPSETDPAQLLAVCQRAHG